MDIRFAIYNKSLLSAKKIWVENMGDNNSIEIKEVNGFSESILEGLQILLPQLTHNFQSLDQEKLEEMIDSNCIRLFIAVAADNNKEIIGTYTMVRFRIPTGSMMRIEDVVVDKKWRRKGIGRMMMEHAIEYAKKNGVTKIELTSHQSRVAANKLYQSFEFKEVETNVYRLCLL